MKKRMHAKMLWLSLLCILLLTGCGKENSSASGSSDTAVNSGNTGSSDAAGSGNAAGGSIVTEKNDAAEGGGNTGISGENIWAAQNGNSSAPSLWVGTKETIPFEEPETGYQQGTLSYTTLGNCVYLMRTEYPDAGGAARLCVQIYDSDTKETEKNIFTLEIPGHEDGYVVSVNLTTKRELSLKLASSESENKYTLVKTDLQGTVLEVEETFPNEDNYPWNQDYLSLTRTFPLTDGSVILCRWDDGNQTSVLTRFDEVTGEKKPLGTLDGQFLNALCCDEEGNLYYYSSTGCIICWDVEKDVKEELTTPLYQEGINIYGTAGLIWNKQGELLLCDLRQDSASLYVLTKEKPVSEKEIRLVCVENPAGTDYMRRMTAVFSRGQEVPIVMEGLNESDYTDYRNRVFAELVAGKGPDILFVSYEDMEILQDKGLLCDLSGMISEDTLNKMIPGVIELGSVNGRLTGITPEIIFETVFTGNETWKADSWTISEFTDLLKERDHWDWPVSFSSDRISYYTLFWMMFCNDLSHSPFLDLEQGKCCFDSQEFIDILNLCKKYGQPSSETRSWEERSRMLREGECLAAISILYDGFYGFSSTMLELGDNCHIIGFPGEAGSNSFITSYSQGYLAVNINAEQKEEIKDYLNFLLSYEKQYEVYGSSVRLDVIRDSIVYDIDGEHLIQRTTAEPDGPIRDIPLKPDGTSFLEEYLEFVQNCKPDPARIPQLSEIIGDELLSCFEGGKSADDAAAAIQNRIQLYLDETMQ